MYELALIGIVSNVWLVCQMLGLPSHCLTVFASLCSDAMFIQFHFQFITWIGLVILSCAEAFLPDSDVTVAFQ